MSSAVVPFAIEATTSFHAEGDCFDKQKSFIFNSIEHHFSAIALI
ncbi:hypothetical protein [Neptuniibacter pectenicola]